MKLTSAEDAIKQAVEAGYERIPAWFPDQAIILLDPRFWQALGKARGWKDKMKRTKDDHIWEGTTLYYALHYFESRLSGKDEKAYWESLP